MTGNVPTGPLRVMQKKVLEKTLSERRKNDCEESKSQNPTHAYCTEKLTHLKVVEALLGLGRVVVRRVPTRARQAIAVHVAPKSFHLHQRHFLCHHGGTQIDVSTSRKGSKRGGQRVDQLNNRSGFQEQCQAGSRRMTALKQRRKPDGGLSVCENYVQ